MSYIFTRKRVSISTSSMYFALQEGMMFLLTPNKLKVTRFPDWKSSGSLSSAPDSSWHIAVTHCKASVWADLMQSTRPKRNRRVDALSYVATSLWYSLHKKQQRYYYTTVNIWYCPAFQIQSAHKVTEMPLKHIYLGYCPLFPKVQLMTLIFCSFLCSILQVIVCLTFESKKKIFNLLSKKFLIYYLLCCFKLQFKTFVASSWRWDLCHRTLLLGNILKI